MCGGPLEKEQIHRGTDHFRLERARGGKDSGSDMPKARSQRADLLSVEGQVRRNGRSRCKAAEGARGGEPEVEAVGGGALARQPGPEVTAHKKILRPPERRKAVGGLRSQFQMSERRAWRGADLGLVSPRLGSHHGAEKTDSKLCTAYV